MCGCSSRFFPGQVWWLNETQATAEHLAYVNDAGRAVIRVDNTTTLPDGAKNRDTVCPVVLRLNFSWLTGIWLDPDNDERLL